MERISIGILANQIRQNVECPPSIQIGRKLEFIVDSDGDKYNADIGMVKSGRLDQL